MFKNHPPSRSEDPKTTLRPGQRVLKPPSDLIRGFENHLPSWSEGPKTTLRLGQRVQKPPSDSVRGLENHPPSWSEGPKTTLRLFRGFENHSLTWIEDLQTTLHPGQKVRKPPPKPVRGSKNPPSDPVGPQTFELREFGAQFPTQVFDLKKLGPRALDLK